MHCCHLKIIKNCWRRAKSLKTYKLCRQTPPPSQAHGLIIMPPVRTAAKDAEEAGEPEEAEDEGKHCFVNVLHDFAAYFRGEAGPRRKGFKGYLGWAK